MKIKALAFLGVASGLVALGVVHAGDPAQDRARAKELFHEAWQLEQSVRIHHGISVRLIDTAGIEEEAADQDTHRAHRLESDARQLERSGDADRTKASLLRNWAHHAFEKAEWDEGQARALRNRIQRDEASRRDQQEAANKLGAAANLEVDVNEKGRLNIEATLILGQAQDGSGSDGARRQRLGALETEARNLRAQGEKWRAEAHQLDSSDGAWMQDVQRGSVAEKAKAHQMFIEAWKLGESAQVRHGAAVRMLEGATTEEEIADQERHKAHQLQSEARRLERDGDQNRTKAALLRSWAHKAEDKAELDECQERTLKARIARDEASRRDQQEAANKLSAAANVEVDGREKGRLSLEASLISQQAQDDSGAETERKQRYENLRAEVEGLRSQARKWFEEAHRLDPNG